MRMHDLRVEMVQTERLSQHPENANNGDVDALVESIDINGFYSPLLVQRSTGRILAGNHRYLVALSRNVPALPCIYLDVDEDAAKRIMLSDNRITRLGHDDEGALAQILTELYESDLSLHGTGYDMDDYTKLMDGINDPLTFDETDIPLPERPDPIISGGMRFVVTPRVDYDGTISELTIEKSDFGTFSRTDINLIRKTLGLTPYSKQDFAAMEAEGRV